MRSPSTPTGLQRTYCRRGSRSSPWCRPLCVAVWPLTSTYGRPLGEFEGLRGARTHAQTCAVLSTWVHFFAPLRSNVSAKQERFAGMVCAVGHVGATVLRILKVHQNDLHVLVTTVDPLWYDRWRERQLFDSVGHRRHSAGDGHFVQSARSDKTS